MTPGDLKRAAGEAAVALVDDGMIVGLGTGSTADCFVAALARAGRDVACVATSERTAALARDHGLAVLDLDAVSRIDLTVDGADEIGPRLAVIKGGGGALLREKLVWEASKRRIVIADESKRASAFGTFPLPIEVVDFGHATTARRIEAALAALAIRAACVLRRSGDRPFRTDGGNLIFDVACGRIVDPAPLGAALKALTGVVEHGLFVGLAERALIASSAGVVTLYP